MLAFTDADVNLLTSLVTLFTVVITGLLARRSIGKVETVVNGKAQDQIARVDQLTKGLHEAGVPIPERFVPGTLTAPSTPEKETE